MTRLIVIRHAQSTANEEGVFLGHLDRDLTELGKKQSQLVADYLIRENIHVDKIYSSDLLRPYHTIEPYAKLTGKEIIKSRNLREIFAGEWEGKRFDDLENLYSDTYSVWLNDISKVKCNGGESIAELYARVNSEIERIALENDGKTVIIVTHATPLRCIAARALGRGLNGLQETGWGKNACLNFFEFENRNLRAIELNVCDHLGNLQSKFPKNV